MSNVSQVLFHPVAKFLFGLSHILQFATFASDNVDHIVEETSEPLGDHVVPVCGSTGQLATLVQKWADSAVVGTANFGQVDPVCWFWRW